MNIYKAWIVLFAFLLPGFAHSQPDADAEAVQRALFVSLLTDEGTEKSVLGARSILMSDPANETLTDAIAEKLNRETKGELRGAAERMAEWHVTLLGRSHNGRYRDLLMRVRERSTYKGLLSAVDSALEDLDRGETDPYVAGTLKLSAVKNDAEKVLSAARRTDRGDFDRIKNNTPLADVLRTLGSPDDTTAWTARAQKLLLHYADQGLFVLTVDHDSWVVAATYPELIPVRPLYNGEHYGIAQALGCFHSRFLTAFMKSEHRQIRQDTDALAVLAKRVEVLPKPEGYFEPASLEIGMKWLAVSKDPKAALILQEVADTAGSEEAKKIANKALKIHERYMAKATSRKPEMEESDDDADEEEKPGA